MKVRLLGIDPGLRLMGWGIIEAQGNSITHVAHGVVKSSEKKSLPERLLELSNGIEKVLNDFQPQEAAVEETFVNANPTSTLKLGMARSVALLMPGRYGISVSEYSANKVKKSVVGVGHAEKQQVAMMIQTLLPGAGPVEGDAADALAVAICHAHYRTSILHRSKAG